MRWAIDSFVRLTEEAYAMRLLGAGAIDSSSWDLVAAELLRTRGGRVTTYTWRINERLQNEMLPDGRVGISFGNNESRFSSNFREDEFEQMAKEEYLDAYRR